MWTRIAFWRNLRRIPKLKLNHYVPRLLMFVLNSTLGKNSSLCTKESSKTHPIKRMICVKKMDEGRHPQSRKLPISSSNINPYRMVILTLLAILGLFFHYRSLNPVTDAYALWEVLVIYEIWFAVSWILAQFPKWFPIKRHL